MNQYHGQPIDGIEASEIADLICMTKHPLHPEVAMIVIKQKTGKQQFSSNTMFHALRVQLQYEQWMPPQQWRD